MTNQEKLLKKLRRDDHDEFGAPFNTYQPFVQTSWIDRLEISNRLSIHELRHLNF